jgi:hypothetical protein
MTLGSDEPRFPYSEFPFAAFRVVKVYGPGLLRQRVVTSQPMSYESAMRLVESLGFSEDPSTCKDGGYFHTVEDMGGYWFADGQVLLT